MQEKKLFFTLSLFLLVFGISFSASPAVAEKSWEQEYKFYLNGYLAKSYAYSVSYAGHIYDRNKYVITGYAHNAGVILLTIYDNGDENRRQTYPGGSIGYSVIDVGDHFIVAGLSPGGVMLLRAHWYLDLDFLKDREYEEPLGRGYAVEQVADGYVIAGASRPDSSANQDVLILKTNYDGEKQCKETFGQYSFKDEGFSIAVAHDGGYIIVGRTESFGARETDVYLIKTNKNCKEEWYKTLGGAKDDWGTSIKRTNDGGYIICGWTTSFGYGAADVYLIKTDSNGNEIWSNVYGGPLADKGHSVQQTKDGGYIIAGFTTSDFFNYNAYLIKTDKAGKLVWEKTFGGSSNTMGNSVIQTPDGGYIIAGTKSSGGTSNLYVVYYHPGIDPVAGIINGLLLLSPE